MSDRRPMTDLGNAERLVSRSGKMLRFVEDRNEWRSWVSPYWRRENMGPVYRAAAMTARSIMVEAERYSDAPNVNPTTGRPMPSDRQQMISHAINSESKRSQMAMIDLAAHISPISCSSALFDADPWVLNTPAGIIDLRDDGSVTPCRPEAMLTRCTRAKFDPMAHAPTWLTFLKTVTCGDSELEGWLQRAIGMTLIGVQREHVFFFLFGDGRNGKGTFVKALLWALGDYGMTLPPNLLIEKKFDSHPTELADLEGRRMAVGSEVPKGSAWDEVRVKALSGGDMIRARRMRQDFVEFTASHTFWVLGNDKPRIRGLDNGIWRRMRLVPFKADISEEDADRDLDAKLAAEADGILWWSLEGCRAYLAQGLGMCAAVQKATEDYQKDEDILGRFLEDCCDLDPNASVSKDSFRSCLRKWLQDGEFRPISDRALKSDLTRRGIEERRPDKYGTREWKGVRLKLTEADRFTWFDKRGAND